MTRLDPIIVPVAIADLRPTQITVGLREVEAKRRRWRERAGGDDAAWLGSHTIPVVVGPKGHYHLIDHHHLARALHDEGVPHIGVTVVARLSGMARDEFWTFLETRGWCHLYDEHGKRRDFTAVPKRVGAMPDDPYRSLAGELRRAGGFAKDTTPFSEFLWAEYLRHRIPIGRLKSDFEKALAKALKLARAQDASFLPGWCGPSSDD